MKQHEFNLVLTTDPNEDDADKLYAVIDDGTFATTAGIARIYFHREAESLEAAIRSAVNHIRSAGFEVERVELEPNSVLLPG